MIEACSWKCVPTPALLAVLCSCENESLRQAGRLTSAIIIGGATGIRSGRKDTRDSAVLVASQILISSCTVRRGRAHTLVMNGSLDLDNVHPKVQVVSV